MKKILKISSLIMCYIFVLSACSESENADEISNSGEEIVIDTNTVENQETETVTEDQTTKNLAKTVEYQGDIDGIKIYMTLDYYVNGEVEGVYYYDQYNQDITLKGTYNENEINLESENKEEQFEGTLNDNGFSGSWNYDGKNLEFSLFDESYLEQKSKEVFAEIGELLLYNTENNGYTDTIINIHDDGTFDGSYKRISTGVTSGDYTIIYESSFIGSLSVTERIGEYAYKLKLEELKYDAEIDSERIEDDVKYIYTDVEGLDEEYYLYLPGQPISEQSEAFLSDYIIGSTSEYLTAYVLYGVDTKKPFYTFEN